MKDTILSRYKIGDKVDFLSCEETKKVFQHTFFKKDGGWGIANSTGDVMVSNILRYPFGQHLGYTDNTLVIDRNIDTGLYGVISIKYAKVIIPFKYTFIELQKVEYPTDQTEKKKRELPFYLTDGEDLYDSPIMKKELFFLVNKGGIVIRHNVDNIDNIYKEYVAGGLWGMYTESGDMVIGTRYYHIDLKKQFVECYSTDDYIYIEDEFDKLRSKCYTGKIDLYTIEGNFIVGGIDLFSHYDDYIIIYAGIQYVKKTETREKLDWYGNKIDYYSDYVISVFDDSACIILDKQFEPVLKSRSNRFENKFKLGLTFKSPDDFCERLAGETIIKGCSVDMQAIDRGLMFLSYPKEYFVVTEFKSTSKEVSIINVCCDGYNNCVEFPNGTWEDHLIEESVLVIVRLSDEGSILWSRRVNEIDMDGYATYMYYRKGEKVGMFSQNGLGDLKYSAISKNFNQNGSLVVAIKENVNPKDFSNPNYDHKDASKITYYEISENGNLIRLDDNRNIFDPRKYLWFPDSFREDNHLFYDECYDDSDYYSGGWSQQELEDAADVAYEGHSRLELGLE